MIKQIDLRWTTGALMWICWTSVPAQSSLPPTLEGCMKIAADKERLHCFDRESAALSHAAAPGPATASAGATAQTPRPATQTETDTPASRTAAETSAKRLTPEQKLGLTEDRVRRLESTQSGVKPPPEVKELKAHVAQLSSGQQGRYVFVLDNGQVWHQTENKASFSIRTGDVVTVSEGAFGSFWISTGPHNSTRVQRAK